jgi:hypothetical protein
MVNAVLRPRAIKAPPGKSYNVSFVGRMHVQLEFSTFFFSLFFYAGAALRFCKTKGPYRNPRESEVLPMS